MVPGTTNQYYVALPSNYREAYGIKAPPQQIEVERRSGDEVDKVTLSDIYVATSTSPQPLAEFTNLRIESATETGLVTVSPLPRVSPFWLILAYFVISLGELCLSPMGLALVSKVAPVRMRGLMMGGWFLATAIGNKLTAIGAYWDVWSHAQFFLVLAMMAFVMAVVLFFLLKPLKKAMPGV
jgi:MFS family permease